MRKALNHMKSWAVRHARPAEILAAAAVAAAIVAVGVQWTAPPATGATLAAWAVAGAFAALALAAYGLRWYRARAADPYAKLRLAREPRFDSPRMGPRAAALAAGEPVIRILPVPGKPAPGEWTVELLRALEWKRFGLLCTAYYGHRQFRVESTDCGARRGVDARLYFKALQDPVAIVHCRAWSRTVGVQPLRELHEAMQGAKVAKGVFHSPSDYTNEARAYALEHRIQLVTAAEFVRKLKELPDAVRKAMMDLVTEGDYTTPTCPECGRKMALHAADAGEVWACSAFPQCRATLQVQTSW